MTRRIVVGAHYGFRDWLAQRVTAAVMAVYSVVFVVAYAVAGPADHAAWRAFFSQGGCGSRRCSSSRASSSTRGSACATS